MQTAKQQKGATMTVAAELAQSESRVVHANGIDIHYLEAGEGEPLVLLHGGMVSTNPIWTGVPVAYASHMGTLANHFRVIAPDTRGAGKTRHTDGTVTFDVLADDVVALIDALELDRPLIAGFSEGGITSTVVGIRHPGAVRAIANHAGYDVFDPDALSFAMLRQALGGSPDATEADPDAAARFFSQSPEMQGAFELMKADEDGGQGDGHWREYLRLVFHRTTQPPGYTVQDLGAITAPTLIVVGDRDEFCSVEDGVRAYRALNEGEFAVVPNTGHFITPALVELVVDFLERWS
jgi:pimeloyl-ACP methyl ester carboxylesterase